jgi:5-carboxymethyl-2-hydroxymuconic-semialdehyde dehydrogenase/aminomuconate-semialdehyde/2-hydroxymuconate-6-semialdehyde dehydrogenase
MAVKSLDQILSENEGVKIRLAQSAGDETRSAAHLIPIVYPATAERVSNLAEDGPGQVEEAVARAREAFENGPWTHYPVARRQEILRSAAGLIREHQAELAVLETLCAGLPASHLQGRQIPRAAENFDFFADYIGTMSGETFEQEPGYLTLVTREPAGVAALVAPWNAPLALASMQIASCIAFGNTCVIKPSEYTPLAVGRMVELLTEAGLPAGAVTVVNGRGAVTGEALVSSPGIDRIAFTGGTATARSIMKSASAALTPVHMELGGKSANIVFKDADLERAVDGSLINIFSNNGQMCIAGSRILVQRDIADRFIERFVARTNNIRVGDPMDPATEIGPLAFEAHLDKVLAYVALARSEGAEILAGGQRVEQLAPGYFMEPTVARVTDNSQRVCQEEVFGPFATIQVFDEPEEAIAIANDSEYGLVGYAWTENLQLGLKIQESIRAGTVWINSPLLRDLRAPFGGFKNSGIGRDGPRQCADFYTEEKATIVPRTPTPLRKMGAGP